MALVADMAEITSLLFFNLSSCARATLKKGFAEPQLQGFWRRKKIAFLKYKLLFRFFCILSNCIKKLTKDLLKNLEDYFETMVEIPRIKVGKQQTIETLINEEALLFAQHLRNEQTKCAHMVCFPCVFSKVSRNFSC